MSFGKVLWKAIDGREFIIDTGKLGINTLEKLHEHIAELRDEHGYEQPDLEKNNMIMHALPFTKEAEEKLKEEKGVLQTRDLPEELAKKVDQNAIEHLQKPDPKKMN